MSRAFVIGMDLGTNTARALIVDAGTGEEIATAVREYPHGNHGVITDAKNPTVARHHPEDYVTATVGSIADALENAAASLGFSPDRVIGIGLDATASTPVPLDESGMPVAFQDRFADNPDAMAWLWKDHSSAAEAEEITELAGRIRPDYLARIGGTYSSEWFWAKALHCAHVAPDVFEASYTWAEVSDWLAAYMCGRHAPSTLKRGACAAGHKALFDERWGGFPEEEFLQELDPGLVRLRKTLPDTVGSIADTAGTLTEEMAGKLGLPAGIPVALPAIDAHIAGVGAGIREKVMVKIVGTSGVDLVIRPAEEGSNDIPGVSGIVPDSVVPGLMTIEAGQSALGDVFNWFVDELKPGSDGDGGHGPLTEGAGRLLPGETGLLALDWHNGNRTVLIDQRLTGMILGLTLHTKPHQIYRALLEATAFGGRVILDRMEEYGVEVERIIACGGIPSKNPLLMQIYADVLNRPIDVAGTEQASALGAAISAAVVAGAEVGGYADFTQAIAAMTGVSGTHYLPQQKHRATYDRLYKLYRDLHDAFGTDTYEGSLKHVMKELIELRDTVATEA